MTTLAARRIRSLPILQATAVRDFRLLWASEAVSVLGDPGIRMMMVVSLVINFALNGPSGVGMAWLAERRFDAGPTGLGLMAAG